MDVHTRNTFGIPFSYDGLQHGITLAVMRHIASKSELTVELGTFQGATAKLLCGWTKGEVLGVDNLSDYWGKDKHDTVLTAKGIEKKVGEPRFKFVKGSADEVGKAWDRGQVIDFLIVDASHDYVDVKADTEAWFPHVNRGGVIAFDDVPHMNPSAEFPLRSLCPGVAAYVQELMKFDNLWFIGAAGKTAFFVKVGEELYA